MGEKTVKYSEFTVFWTVRFHCLFLNSEMTFTVFHCFYKRPDLTVFFHCISLFLFTVFSLFFTVLFHCFFTVFHCFFSLFFHYIFHCISHWIQWDFTVSRWFFTVYTVRFHCIFHWIQWDFTVYFTEYSESSLYISLNTVRFHCIFHWIQWDFTVYFTEYSEISLKSHCISLKSHCSFALNKKYVLCDNKMYWTHNDEHV